MSPLVVLQGDPISFGSLIVNGSIGKDIEIDAARLEGDGLIAGNVILNGGILATSTLAGTLQIDGSLNTSGNAMIESGTVSVRGSTPISDGVLTVGAKAIFTGDGPIEMSGGGLDIKGVVQKDLAVQGTIVAVGDITGAVDFIGNTEVNSGGCTGSSFGCTLLGSSANIREKIRAVLNVRTEFTLVQISGGLEINNGATYESVEIGSDGRFTINTVEKTHVGQVNSDGTLEIHVDDGGGNAGPTDVTIDKATVTEAGTVLIDTSSDTIIHDFDVSGTVFPNPSGGAVIAGTVSGPGTLAISVEAENVGAGNSPGTLTFSHDQADALTLNLKEALAGQGPGTIEFEVNDATGVAGDNPGWDLIDITNGGMTFDTTNGNDFVVDVLSLGLDNEAGVPANFDTDQSYTWRFLDTALGFFGTDVNQIDFLVNASQFAAVNGVSADRFSIVQDTPTSLAVSYDATVTPEPIVLTWDNQGGAGDSRWSTPANWDPDAVPNADAQTHLANGDTLLLNSAGQAAQSVFVDNGTLHLGPGGQLNVVVGVNVATGSTLRVDGTLDAATTHVAGTLSGAGTLAAPATVASGGTVSPGGGIGSLTTDSVTFEAGSTLLVELSGPGSGGVHDQLDVEGMLNLDAAGETLALRWTPDGPLSVFGGDYVVALYGLRAGEFDLVGGGGDPYRIGEAYVAGVDYVTGNQITVSLYSLLDGDADLDGDVDFGDYLALEAAFGGAGQWRDGDFDFNGIVDFGDYLILEAAFGDSVPAELAAAAIPEPSTFYLLGVGALGLLAYTRRRRR